MDAIYFLKKQLWWNVFMLVAGCLNAWIKVTHKLLSMDTALEGAVVEEDLLEIDQDISHSSLDSHSIYQQSS